MKPYDKIKLLGYFSAGLITSLCGKSNSMGIDWMAIATLSLGFCGLYFTVRKEFRENAKDRQAKEEDLVERIDKKLAESEFRIREAVGDLKTAQNYGINKIELLNHELSELRSEFKIHVNSPGHPGAMHGIDDLKKMISELAAAIARKG